VSFGLLDFEEREHYITMPLLVFLTNKPHPLPALNLPLLQNIEMSRSPVTSEKQM
jgi:hypothetical protein